MTDLREKLLSANSDGAPSPVSGGQQVQVALQAVEQALLALTQARQALLGVSPEPVVDEFGVCSHPDSEREIIRTYRSQAVLCRRCGEFLE